MEVKFIGRKAEKEILKEALDSPEAELISVIGRRRIGKTFLVNHTFNDKIVFEMAGIKNASMEKQLKNFTAQLSQFMGELSMPMKQPEDWFDAFVLLIKYLEQIPTKGKKVIFFDELPWLATRKSGFLSAFGYFWNSWASKNNVVVVICGSAASWMIQKVVKDKGGLHNRITKRIYLNPFSLGETEAYLQSRNIFLNRYQILHLYMALGGVPHYLKEVRKGRSVVQNIDQICFSNKGLLKDEFSQLYPALFDFADKHIEIVRLLASRRKGLTRNDIIAKSGFTNGGGISKILDELEQSGFISSYYPFGKKKVKKLYRLTDEYSIFYLQFMENKKHEGEGTWQHLSQTQEYISWSGFAFEGICLKHIPQIKRAMSIGGVYSLSSAFYTKGDKIQDGAQIDLVLDRNDHVINLFELKFHKEEFAISKAYAEKLRTKRRVFREVTKTKKHLSWVLISTFGLSQNQHSLGLIESDLTMEALFE